MSSIVKKIEDRLSSTIKSGINKSEAQKLVLGQEEAKETPKPARPALNRNYKLLLPIIALGGFLLFYFSASSMIKILEFATIISFITAPIIGFLNLKAMTSDEIPEEYFPKLKMVYLAYVGLVANILFALFYLYYLI